MAFSFTITTAGLDALVNAQGGATEAIRITELGLTQSTFVTSPTLIALPGEFKRLISFAGQSVSESIIHMTAADNSDDVYDLRGIGFYLDDGTLFAVYGQEEPIFRKVNIASFLTAFDVAFGSDVEGSISFGDSSFLYPPASEREKGVAEIASQEEAAAGTDDQRIITPFKLKTLMDALAQALGEDVDAVTAALVSLAGRSITGSGLVTGGGDLTANRTLSVSAASASDAMAESSNTRAITPKTLAGFARDVGQSGFITLPGTGGLIIQHGRFAIGTQSAAQVTWPTAFPSACFAAICDGALTDTSFARNYVSFRTESITRTGAAAYNNEGAMQASFIAIGR